MFQIKFNQEMRDILHIDADAFFASVEQALNPKLKNKPIMVGGPSGTNGIVSAASYEAKRLGIYTGMPTYLARKKCPQGIFVNGNFRAYREFSKRMHEIFLSFTPDVEMASIDEAFLDVTGCEGGGAVTAKAILNAVYQKLGITVSCGFASNKTVCKVASSMNKPHKLTIVPFGKESEFLAPLSLRALPGVGPKSFTILERYGFKTVGDVAELSLGEVVEKFGVKGVPLWKKCCGVDNRRVFATDTLPKSISKEHTFYPEADNHVTALRVLRELTENVLRQLRKHEMKAKTVCLKVRYKLYDGENTKFKDFSFQAPIGGYSFSDSSISPIVKALFLKNILPDRPIRLLGVGVSNLSDNYNLPLFSSTSINDNLFHAIDKLQNLHGDQIMSYGA